MSEWETINGVDLATLRAIRKELHQAVQLVSLVPRYLLPHDPTDGTASLIWNEKNKELESIPVENEEKLEIHAGLSFSKFELYLATKETKICSLPLEGKSTQDGLKWLKDELEKIALPANKIAFDLPYEIENYDYSKSLKTDKSALMEFSRLYQNTNQMLLTLVTEWEKAYDIRCWPHHFDLATLITVETDENDEILKSIGVGLSPGDEGIDEPYLYVNVWPNVDSSILSKHPLPAGNWNKDDWAGAVLTYSQLLNQQDQQQSLSTFMETAIQSILSELK